MLKLNSIYKSYKTGGHELFVLKGINILIEQGQSVAIVGPSGSGKTTLLGISAGLDTPSKGRVELLGNPFSEMGEDQRAAIRNQFVGFIFQNFQLIPTLTALENVCIPMELQKRRDAARIAGEWLERVGLKDRLHHYPIQLSGGEQQRVAIARASAHQPDILFADEPTGNLDGSTSEQIEELLFRTHRETQNTMVLVTHDMELAAKADRIIRLQNGNLCADSAAT
jgi:putative ABC transport system ATP-binding protein